MKTYDDLEARTYLGSGFTTAVAFTNHPVFNSTTSIDIDCRTILEYPRTFKTLLKASLSFDLVHGGFEYKYCNASDENYEELDEGVFHNANIEDLPGEYFEEELGLLEITIKDNIMEIKTSLLELKINLKTGILLKCTSKVLDSCEAS